MQNQIKKKNFIIFIITSIVFTFLSVTYLFGEDFYDLCYSAYMLRNNKILFVRYKNPTLDPILRTFELNIFNPKTGKILMVNRPDEKIYILPSISGDRSTISYHSIIVGNDYLVTYNIEKGKSIRLGFDTGGYFTRVAIDYDNDTVAAAIKRGESRQAIYLISNRKSFIKRIVNGTEFEKIGFLYNGDVFYLDNKKNRKELGYYSVSTGKKFTIHPDASWVKKSKNGDVLVYQSGNELFLFRAYGGESIKISKDFSLNNSSLVFSEDGSAVAICKPGNISIINFPSGDALYFLSIEESYSEPLLSNFKFYCRVGTKILSIFYKKPAQVLSETYIKKEPYTVLGVSSNDRYIAILEGEKLIIYDLRNKKEIPVKFDFTIENIKFTEDGSSIYIAARRHLAEKGTWTRELYLYNIESDFIFKISTAENTPLEPYLTNKEDLKPFVFE